MSQWIVTINLLGAGRKLAGKYNLGKPVAIFKGEGRKLELGAVFTRLGNDLRELAKGVEFQSPSGALYRVFVVVSHLMGDIPALREGLCLNIPSSCKHPCVFCRIRNHRTHPPTLAAPMPVGRMQISHSKQCRIMKMHLPILSMRLTTCRYLKRFPMLSAITSYSVDYPEYRFQRV